MRQFRAEVAEENNTTATPGGSEPSKLVSLPAATAQENVMDVIGHLWKYNDSDITMIRNKKCYRCVASPQEREKSDGVKVNDILMFFLTYT